jgi:hypothetical protein
VVGDVAVLDWQMWSNYDVTRGIILVNGVVPRGPVMGCHVAPLLLAIGLLFKILWSPWGSNPGPPLWLRALVECGLPLAHTLLLVNYIYNMYFNCN